MIRSKIKLKLFKITIYSSVIAYCLLNTGVMYAANKKPKVTITNFTSNNIDDAYKKMTQARVEKKIYDSKQFDILEREKFHLVYKENELKRDTIKKYTLLQLDYIITGSIEKNYRYTLTIKVIEANTGNVIILDSEYIENIRALKVSIDNLCNRIISNLAARNNKPVKAGNTTTYTSKQTDPDHSYKTKKTHAIYITYNYFTLDEESDYDPLHGFSFGYEYNLNRYFSTGFAYTYYLPSEIKGDYSDKYQTKAYCLGFGIKAGIPGYLLYPYLGLNVKGIYLLHEYSNELHSLDSNSEIYQVNFDAILGLSYAINDIFHVYMAYRLDFFNNLIYDEGPYYDLPPKSWTVIHATFLSS